MAHFTVRGPSGDEVGSGSLSPGGIPGQEPDDMSLTRLDHMSIIFPGLPCPMPDTLGSHIRPTLTGGCALGMLDHDTSCSVTCDVGYQKKHAAGTETYSCYAQTLTPATLECEGKNGSVVPLLTVRSENMFPAID